MDPIAIISTTRPNSKNVYIGPIGIIDLSTNKMYKFENIDDMCRFIQKNTNANIKNIKSNILNRFNKQSIYYNYKIFQMPGGKLLDAQKLIEIIKRRLNHDYYVEKMSLFKLMLKYQMSLLKVVKFLGINKYGKDDIFGEHTNIIIRVKNDTNEYVFTNLESFAQFCTKNNLFINHHTKTVSYELFVNSILHKTSYKYYGYHITVYDG